METKKVKNRTISITYDRIWIQLITVTVSMTSYIPQLIHIQGHLWLVEKTMFGIYLGRVPRCGYFLWRMLCQTIFLIYLSFKYDVIGEPAIVLYRVSPPFSSNNTITVKTPTTLSLLFLLLLSSSWWLFMYDSSVSRRLIHTCKQK